MLVLVNCKHNDDFTGINKGMNVMHVEDIVVQGCKRQCRRQAGC